MLRAVTESAPTRATQSSWMVSSGATRAGIAFASNLVLVRFIAPEQFGEFALALAAIGMFETVISLRVGLQVLRLSDKELDAHRKRIYWNVLLYEVAAAGTLSALWLWLIGSLSLWTGLLLAGMLTQHWIGHTTAFFERQQPYRRLAALEAGSAVIAHVLAIGLVLFGAGAAALYLRELALGLLLVGSMGAVGGLHRERLYWLGSEDWRRLLREVRGIWLEGVLDGAFQRVSLLLAGAVGTAGGVGFFYQARRLAFVPQQLLAPVTGRMTLTWLSGEREPAAQHRLLRRLGMGLALPLAGVAALSLGYAEVIIPLLFGDGWRPAAKLLESMTGVIVFYSLFGVMKTYLIATHRMRLLLAARLLQWAALLLPLAPWLFGSAVGVEQIAMGLSLSYMLSFAVCLVFATRTDSARTSG